MSYDFSEEPQVTFDSEAELGYLYLVKPLSEKITRTEELEVNPDLMLDFGRNDRVVGVEFRGDSLEELKQWSGKSHVFQRIVGSDNIAYFTIRFSDKLSKSKFSPKSNCGIVFHFSDEHFSEFLGIDLYDLESYSSLFLTGQ